MTSNQLVVGAAVLWWSCASADVFPAAVGGQVAYAADAAEGLSSLADISRMIEAQGSLMSSDAPFDLLAAWMTGGDRGAEGRGKKPKPAMMAMTMAGVAAASMLMMKAMAAIKLFIIHAFFATKLGLVIGAYLLASKLMEMKQSPAKSVQVKWVSAPPTFDEHPPQMPPHYPDAGQSSYEPQQEPQQQQPADQYGPPPQQQHYMSSGDFGGGGGDMQAHYSHLSPVTYRPTMVVRNQSDNMAKSARVKP